MSGKVYADGDEVVSKGGEGKVTSAFPDVCMSPPGPPAGPLPVPYPDSSLAKDLKNGSKTVQIRGQEVALRDESYYATSPLGNEAATRNFGGSVVTHTITGKTYFASWSMDVKGEGQGVVRHLDLTTSNHGSYPGGTPPFPNLSESQTLAVQRVEEGKCPCCGEESCPAAFQDGEEPLALEEFYEIDSKPGRREQYDYYKDCKERLCTCNGRVFPEPPCDVFRVRDEARCQAIVQRWESQGTKIKYREYYERTTGTRLKGMLEFMNELIAKNGNEAALRRAAKASRGELARPGNEQLKRAREAYEKLSVKARRLERINHLVPKEAGGCPDNPSNLQPQQTLCETCQEIDQFLTDNWQGR